MKNILKIHHRGGMLNSLFIVLLLFLLAISSVLCVFAGAREAEIQDGDTIYFNHDEDAGGVDLFTVPGTDLRGFCIDPGTHALDDGSATVDAVRNSSALAKVLYYVYYHGWDTDDKIYSQSAGPLPSGWQYRMTIQAMAQYAYLGQAAVNYWKSNPTYNSSIWTDTNIGYITDLVDEIKAGPDVPSGFAVFVAENDGQDFGVFYEPTITVRTGKLNLKKASANPSITG